MPTTPVVPEFITVHLGRPDQPARNVTVPFTDYIKNVVVFNSTDLGSTSE